MPLPTKQSDTTRRGVPKADIPFPLRRTELLGLVAILGGIVGSAITLIAAQSGRQIPWWISLPVGALACSTLAWLISEPSLRKPMLQVRQVAATILRFRVLLGVVGGIECLRLFFIAARAFENIRHHHKMPNDSSAIMPILDLFALIGWTTEVIWLPLFLITLAGTIARRGWGAVGLAIMAILQIIVHVIMLLLHARQPALWLHTLALVYLVAAATQIGAELGGEEAKIDATR